MIKLSTEMILAFVVAVTGTTTLIGLLAICYVILCRSEKSSDEHDEEQHEQRQQERHPNNGLDQSTFFSLPSSITSTRKNTKSTSASDSPINFNRNNQSSFSNDDGSSVDYIINPDNHPRIRMFSSDEDDADENNSLDIITANNFDDNWSYAMVSYFISGTLKRMISKTFTKRRFQLTLSLRVFPVSKNIDFVRRKKGVSW
jgi:hypothetical protein